MTGDRLRGLAIGRSLRESWSDSDSDEERDRFSPLLCRLVSFTCCSLDEGLTKLSNLAESRLFSF